MLLLSPHFTETKAAEYAGIMLGKSEYTVCQQCLDIIQCRKVLLLLCKCHCSNSIDHCKMSTLVL